MQYAPEISGDLSCQSLVIKYFALPSRLKVFSVWFCIEIIQNFRLIFFKIKGKGYIPEKI